MCGIFLMLFIQSYTFSSYWLTRLPLLFVTFLFSYFHRINYETVKPSSSSSFHTGSFYTLIINNLAFSTLSLCPCYSPKIHFIHITYDLSLVLYLSINFIHSFSFIHSTLPGFVVICLYFSTAPSCDCYWNICGVLVRIRLLYLIITFQFN